MSEDLESIAYGYPEGKYLRYNFEQKEYAFKNQPDLFNEIHRLIAIRQLIGDTTLSPTCGNFIQRTMRYVLIKLWVDYFNADIKKDIEDTLLTPVLGANVNYGILANFVISIFNIISGGEDKIYTYPIKHYFGIASRVNNKRCPDYKYKKTVKGGVVIFEPTHNGAVVKKFLPISGKMYTLSPFRIKKEIYDSLLSKMRMPMEDPDYIIFCALVRYTTLYGNENFMERKEDHILNYLMANHGCQVNLLGNMFNATGPYFSIAHDLDWYFGSEGFLPAVRLKSGFYYCNDVDVSDLILENTDFSVCPLGLYIKEQGGLEYPEGVLTYTNDIDTLLLNKAAAERFSSVLPELKREFEDIVLGQNDVFDTVYQYASSYMSPTEFHRLVEARSKQHGIDYQQELDRMIIDLSELERVCIDRSSEYGKPLKEYQEKAVKFMIRNRGMIAAFEMGTGKTLTAVAVIKCVMGIADYLGTNIKVIIITPASLGANLAGELDKYIGRKTYMSNKIVGDDRVKFYTFSKFQIDYNAGLIDCKRSLIVVDEAHNFRKDYRNIFNETLGSPAPPPVEGTRAEMAVECVSKAWKVLLLTATPIYNKPHDLVNLASMVNGVFPPYDFDLATLSDEELLKVIGGKILFQGRDPTQFPKRSDIVYSIVMSREYLSKYEHIQKRIRDEQSSKRKTAKIEEDGENYGNAFLTKVRQSVNNLEPCLKCDVALNIVADAVSNGRKVIFYSEFLEAGTDIITSRLKAMGIGYEKITGEISKKKRADIVERYNNPNSGLMVLSITKAGGEGLDLIGVRDIILMEKGWTNSGMEQVIGRGIRFRSHKHLPEDQQNVTIHHLVMVKPTDLLNSDYQKALIGKLHSVIEYDLRADDTQAVKIPKEYSADVILFNLSEKKEEINRRLYSRLENIQVGMVEAVFA